MLLPLVSQFDNYLSGMGRKKKESEETRSLCNTRRMTTRPAEHTSWDGRGEKKERRVGLVVKRGRRKQKEKPMMDLYRQPILKH